MRIPLVGVELPGPGTVVREASDGLGELLSLVPRAAALLARAEALLDRADDAVTRVETVLDRAEVVAGRAQTVATRAGQVVALADEDAQLAGVVARRAGSVAEGASGLVERIDALLLTLEPTLRRLVPLLDHVLGSVEGPEVLAGEGLLDRLPVLLRHVDEDVLPMLSHLDEITPDVHSLLEAVQDLRQVVAGLPGAKFLRRHGRDDADDERLDHEHR